MNKIIKTLCVCLLAALMLVGCGGGKDSDDTTTVNTNTDSVPPYDENAEITIEYDGESTSGSAYAELVISGTYRTSKTIKITVPENQHFLAVSISKGVLDESIVYLEDGVFTYKIPDFSRSYPPKLKQSGNTISARIPTVSELESTHNIALNTSDLLKSQGVYPHASTTNTNNDDAEWMARNIIDGFTQNNAHGEYPYQSWGPKDSVSRKDNIKIDFGHDVNVEELVLYIRADFPHDGYWNSCTLRFSDGSTQKIQISGTGKAQTIAIEGGKTTSSLTFTEFIKAPDSQGQWCAWIELQVNGSEIMTQ